MPFLARFEDKKDPLPVYKVDIEELQQNDPETWRALVNRLSEIHGDPVPELLAEFERVGIPLRACIVTKTYTRREQLEELIPGISEVLAWEDMIGFDW